MNQKESSLTLKLFHPKGRLSPYVQGVWSASVAQGEPNSIKRWLQADACSGILFNFGGPIYLDNTQYSDNVILLPISKQAISITLPSGSQVAGVQFHPGVSFELFGKYYHAPVSLYDCPLQSAIQLIANRLINIPSHQSRIVTLYKWLNNVINFSDVNSKAFLQSMSTIQNNPTLALLSNDMPLSQCQLLRLFQKRMGMTIKEYQRVLRVKKTLNSLKMNPDIELVALALDKGFSDQSHMTRELKRIAKITPWQYGKLIAGRQA